MLSTKYANHVSQTTASQSVWHAVGTKSTSRKNECPFAQECGQVIYFMPQCLHI